MRQRPASHPLAAGPQGRVARGPRTRPRRQRSDGLRSLMASLPPRQAAIISLRFGLDDGKQHTLAEVAELVGLTRERVRQLEKHALAELRNPKRHANLLPWAS